MLDHFLEVAYEQEKQASMQEQVVDELKKLPVEELHKIVSGETKLAYHDAEGGCWLDQFKGSDMYQTALDLETKSLELDVQQQQQDRQRRNEDRDGRDAMWDQKDAIRVQKRMLELDLRKQEAGLGAESGGEELPEPEEAEEEAEETPVTEAAEAVEEAKGAEEPKEASVIDELAAERGARLIESMRMSVALEKTAKGPLRAAEYWDDPISDAASHGVGAGQVTPEQLQMMQGQVRGDIEGQIADQARSAQYIKDHPIKGRLPNALMGGIAGAGLGGLMGGAEYGYGPAMSGKGMLIGGGLGALAGAALTPGHKARMAEHADMQQASQGLTDPALQMALQRSMGQQGQDRQHQMKMERSQAKGENAARIQALMQGAGQPKMAAAFISSDAWGREMAKQAAYDQFVEESFEKMAAVGFENLDEMEKEAIMQALRAAAPIAKRFMGRAGSVLSKTYQGAGGGGAGVMEAAKKIPGLAMKGGKRLVRGVKGAMPGMPTMAGVKDKAMNTALDASVGLANLRNSAGMAAGQALSGR